MNTFKKELKDKKINGVGKKEKFSRKGYHQNLNNNND